jgi:amino acid transporter
LPLPTLQILTKKKRETRACTAGFPDNGYFGHVSKWTHTPLRAIWLTTLLSILPGLLDFASPVAANAIFSLTAMALDISYIIPIALRRIFQHHPEVQFKPGPFYLGDGLLGWAVNLNCIVWTLFVSVIFSLPTYLPVTSNTMNYSSVITGSVLLLAMYVRSVGPSGPSRLPSCQSGSGLITLLIYLPSLSQDLVLRRVRIRFTSWNDCDAETLV